ncbi:MAG: malto-oligosyltrehalose trehalohydrolase [Verrucomicrobia bacterium]|nr:malto-oligosyltrehalose trehalohydrolase [Verrucomicrobiota bacterium]
MNSKDPNVIPVGALVTVSGVTYRLWAPGRSSVGVMIGDHDPRLIALAPEPNGYWSAHDGEGRAGDRYRFVLDGGPSAPDPASRWQPDGVHGYSACVDPAAYVWKADGWSRPQWTGQVIYELHVGAFTDAGTFLAAIDKLDHVRALGAEAIELMPLGDFPGNRNWGYDGVALYAPARCYGTPDDLRALVDAAHFRGLAVILDVVYNHLGPVGNYLPEFSSRYFHATESTPWGSALNLDGEASAGVRSFLLGNAAYWLDEFRVDGLRVDATHAIVDHSPRHFLSELSALVHARGAFLIAEDERNSLEILHTPENAGAGFDAAWSDDFHHQLRVALTGNRESYFASYPGTFAALADTLGHGWFYRGQPYPFWRGKPRGAECTHLSPAAFVLCIENHDQVGNRAGGERLEHLVSPAAYGAAAVLLCLSPYSPLLFMGQEWASSSPFLFFTDHEGERGKQVSEGRKKEFEQSGLNAGVTDVPDPQDLDTFQRSKLDWSRRDEKGAATLELFRACLRERHHWLTPSARARDRWRVAASEEMLVVRYSFPDGDRALVFALRPTSPNAPLPSLLEKPEDHGWFVTLDSEGGRSPLQPGAPWPERFEGAQAVWLHLRRMTS